jgi:putative intracellular protease/amidase
MLRLAGFSFPALALVLMLGTLLSSRACQGGDRSEKPPGRILMVLTSVDRVPGTSRPTGYWAEELVVPCERFEAAGYEVVTCSPRGGIPPVDPASLDPKAVGEDASRRYSTFLEKSKSLLQSRPLRDVQPTAYDAIFVVGGHGVMWDLTESRDMQALVRKAYAAGRVVSAVCHGPGALVRVKLDTGEPLLRGHRVTGFSAREEELAGMAPVVPYSLQAELEKASGGRYEAAAPWQIRSVVSQSIVTGQNPASSGETARQVLRLLAVRSAAGKSRLAR